MIFYVRAARRFRSFASYARFSCIVLIAMFIPLVFLVHVINSELYEASLSPHILYSLQFIHIYSFSNNVFPIHTANTAIEQHTHTQNLLYELLVLGEKNGDGEKLKHQTNLSKRESKSSRKIGKHRPSKYTENKMDGFNILCNDTYYFAMITPSTALASITSKRAFNTRKYTKLKRMHLSILCKPFVCECVHVERKKKKNNRNSLLNFHC